MSNEIMTLGDASFDEHVKTAEIPVLVDFWAEWCGPCKMIAPAPRGDRRGARGKVPVAKLNIDDNLDITRRFDVMSIPTLILFKDGEPAQADHRSQAQGPACCRRSLFASELFQSRPWWVAGASCRCRGRGPSISPLCFAARR